jgi:hypothetical protein
MIRDLRNPLQRLAAALIFILATGVVHAAEPQPRATPTRFTATTAGLGSDSGVPIRIDVLRFTSDEEGQALVAAVGEKGLETLPAQLAGKPSLGYVWTNQSVGYLVRYAVRSPLPGGGERIVVVIDRPLGSLGLQPWKPAPPAAATDYPFTLIELHLNGKGVGEGKLSLAGTVQADAATRTLGLENYSAAPLLLQGAKREQG